MKMIKKLTSYGIVNFIEVAGIDMTKDKTHSLKFKPDGVSYSQHIGKDIRIENLGNNLSDFDKNQFSFMYNTVYSFPLEEFNLNWHIVNKDFKSEDEYLSKMKKLKTCPIVVNNVSFMEWFVKMYHYLNDEWKADNSDYMAMMDIRILKNNEKMLDGFKNQDAKVIRQAVKLSADINFTQDGNSAIKYTIENQNDNLLKYLINKKVEIPSNLVVSPDNKLYEALNSYTRKPKKSISGCLPN